MYWQSAQAKVQRDEETNRQLIDVENGSMPVLWQLSTDNLHDSSSWNPQQRRSSCPPTICRLSKMQLIAIVSQFLIRCTFHHSGNRGEGNCFQVASIKIKRNKTKPKEAYCLRWDYREDIYSEWTTWWFISLYQTRFLLFLLNHLN